jgi:predicted nucleic acid-binding protein
VSYLLDTMVVSRGAKTRADPRLDAWLAMVSSDSLYISVVTLAELAKGVDMLPFGERRNTLSAWLDIDLPDAFAGRILDIDRVVAVRWGKAQARLGRTLPAADALIASTALEHDLTIVTRNTRDFADFGVALVNPWHERAGA